MAAVVKEQSGVVDLVERGEAVRMRYDAGTAVVAVRAGHGGTGSGGQEYTMDGIGIGTDIGRFLAEPIYRRGSNKRSRFRF